MLKMYKNIEELKGYELTTNNHFREVIYIDDKDAIKEGLDVEEVDIIAGFYYKKRFYKMNEIVSLRNPFYGDKILAKYFDGMYNSGYGGLFIKLSDCGESVQVISF